jgi:Fungal N-terminal domain of STAND proteins
MPVGFGFSAGDFVAALKLVGTVIDALRDSGEAGTAYRELFRELHSLETALLYVRRLDGEEIPQAEIISLRQVAAQCQSTIDDFGKKVQKYQPHLGFNHSPTPVKSGWMKIRWAVCKKDDIAKFKARLVGHTEAINILINAIAMCACLARRYSVQTCLPVAQITDHTQRPKAGPAPFYARRHDPEVVLPLHAETA